MKHDQQQHGQPGKKETKKISDATSEQRSQRQAMGQTLGRANDQGRDGKERRTQSPHNR